jgi:hypothetical protein
MAFVLVWSVIAFTLLYGFLVMLRYRLAELEDGLEERELARAISERVAAASPRRTEPAMAGVET